MGGMEAGWALTWACVCHCCRSVAGGGVRRRVLWRAAVGCTLPTCDHMRRLPSKVLTRVRSLCGVVWLLRCTPSSVPASCCACLRRCRYLASCSPSTRLTQLHSALRGWLCLGAHSVCVAWRAHGVCTACAWRVHGVCVACGVACAMRVYGVPWTWYEYASGYHTTAATRR